MGFKISFSKEQQRKRKKFKDSKLTEEQKEMIRNSECNPDDEAPAMTAEQLKEFKSGRLYHPQFNPARE